MSFSKILFKIWWYKLSYLVFTPLGSNPNKNLGVWIRIHMDIFGILDPDPDPHENLCRSETLTHRAALESQSRENRRLRLLLSTGTVSSNSSFVN